MTYRYDGDGNRAGTTYPTPESYAFGYTYTGRNQLQSVSNVATFGYNTSGNLVSRNLVGVNAPSSYQYDSRDRVTQIVHTLVGTTRTFNYDYYPNSDDRKWTQRLITPNSNENNKGEVFSYDQEDQVTAVLLDIANPDTASPGNQTIFYDSSGNRNWYAPLGVNKHYDPDANHPLSNLNQYTGVTINGSLYNLSYRADANLAHYDNNNSTYNYDAQNRLTSATVNNATMSFAYDGLNRQVSRKTGANGTPTYNVWDGWDLIEEYQVANHSATTTAAYVYGAGGLIAGGVNGQSNYYYQDGSGSTALLSDSTGHLLEWYRYDLDGAPMFYNPNDTQRNPNQSGYGVRHLFTGQQWYSDIQLYDMRNRFYSPDLGRFLQPDPIGFRGGNNLYRYCRNNPVSWRDPFGLTIEGLKAEEGSDNDVYYGGEEAYPGGDGSDSNYGYEPNPGATGQGDPVTMGGPPPTDNPGGMGATVPGASFFGANSGSGGMPSEASGARGSGLGNGPGGGPGGQGGLPPGTPSGAPGLSPTGVARSGGARTEIPGGPHKPWLPEWLLVPDPFPDLASPTPEDIAWTNSGFWPTVVVATVIFAPEALPDEFPELLFGRGLFGAPKGILNSNNWIRVGWGWKGPIQQEVFRVAVGPAGSSFHFHIDILTALGSY